MKSNIIKFCLLSYSIFLSSQSWAENTFKPYYGRYRILEISCTYNDQPETTCLKWKQVEFKAHPTDESFMCVLMKSDRSTSSDCYKEENIISDKVDRISKFSLLENGARFTRDVKMEQIIKNYLMDLTKNDQRYFSLTRDDYNFFPPTGEEAHGKMTMTLQLIKN